MKRFHFTLQALLQLKKRKEEQRMRELAKANQLLMQAGDEMAGIEAEWKELQTAEYERRKRGSTPDSMGHAVWYRLRLQQKAIDKNLEIQRLEAARVARRAALAKASQEKKAIENVRERQFGKWKLLAHRQEMKTVDDLSQIQYLRNAGKILK